MVYRSRGAWPMSAWLAMQALRATSTVGAQHAGCRAQANICASVSKHACKHGTSAWATCLVGGMTRRATDGPSRCRWHAGSVAVAMWRSRRWMACNSWFGKSGSYNFHRIMCLEQTWNTSSVLSNAIHEWGDLFVVTRQRMPKKWPRVKIDFELQINDYG